MKTLQNGLKTQRNLTKSLDEILLLIKKLLF